jgi:hypothetical protein
MPARQTSLQRSPAKAGVTIVPKGARIPQPALAYGIVRAIFIGALVLFFASPSILRWAEANSTSAVGFNQPGGVLFGTLLTPSVPQDRPVQDREKHQSPKHDTVTPLFAALTITALRPGVVATLGKIGVLGAYLMTAEFMLATWGMWRQRRTTARVPTIYLLVRATMPSFSATAGRMGGSSTPSGDQFFRAIQKAIPHGSARERFAGTAPWVAFTLTGLPDQPVELGIVIADPHPKRRTETAMVVRAIIQGQLPGAQVDASPDPLTTVLRPGVVLAWRECGLKLPPHYPLRFVGDIEGSDLLGPLAAAIAPRGTLRTEAQIIVRPAQRWALNWGWRGAAMAVKLNLEAKSDYALSEDAKRIEAKLDAAPFEATIRIVAVADGAEAHARVHAALNETAHVIGEYHQGTSHHLQELVQIAAGAKRMRAETAPLNVHTRAPRFAPPPPMLLPIRTWRQTDILTSIEIAGLWHPPIGSLGNLIRWLPCKIIAPPPNAFIPDERSDRITVGMAKRADGTIAPVGPTLRDIRPPMHITAGMGAGKRRRHDGTCEATRSTPRQGDCCSVNR